jgi:riboflavin synthase
MFTGLVSAVGAVRAVSQRGTGRQLWIEANIGELQVGESIACDGVCLTVELQERGAFQVTAGEETLRRTTFSDIAPGSRVHLERALLPTDRLGGHLVTGHVDGIGRYRRVARREGFIEIEVECPTSLMRFLVEKGSVTLDGVSLTVNSVGADWFSVGIIPHTSEVTRIGQAAEGQRVNLEVDLIARYVARMVGPWSAQPSLENP